MMMAEEDRVNELLVTPPDDLSSDSDSESESESESDQ